MAISGVDIVEQLRGRMKFYHVGDPVRKDMGAACEEISELRLAGSSSGHTAASVGAWLDAEGVKLLPWQRKRLGLAPPPREQDLAPIESGV